MRGDDLRQDQLFSYVSTEERIPADHPLRKLRVVVNGILESMSAELSAGSASFNCRCTRPGPTRRRPGFRRDATAFRLRKSPRWGEIPARGCCDALLRRTPSHPTPRPQAWSSGVHRRADQWSAAERMLPTTPQLAQPFAAGVCCAPRLPPELVAQADPEQSRRARREERRVQQRPLAVDHRAGERPRDEVAGVASKPVGPSCAAGVVLARRTGC